MKLNWNSIPNTKKKKELFKIYAGQKIRNSLVSSPKNCFCKF
jgi:hypothetical protein